MVVGATAVLGRRRAAALVALTAAAAAYTAGAGSLWDATVWWDVAFFGFVLLPATFALAWLALPLQGARGLLPVGLALAALSVALYLADLDVAFNLVKLAALVVLGFWFVAWFDAVSWVVLVAVIIPWVDVLSVWRGPTEYVVEQKPGVFDRISVAFREPGSDRSANLGPPDILFFALFLAAARRFDLRVGWTWAGMTAGLGATIALAVWTDASGLPALPAVCVGFLVPNADLLWRRFRRR